MLRRYLILIVFMAPIFLRAQIYLADNGLSITGTGVNKKVRLGGSLLLNTSFDLGATFTYNIKKGTANYLHILNNGNVGFGTNAPTAQLHSTGSVRFAGLLNDIAAPRVITSDINGNLSWMDAATFGGGAGSWAVNGVNVNNTNTGNIGIGVSIPAFKLDVNGSSNITGYFGANNGYLKVFDGDGIYINSVSPVTNAGRIKLYGNAATYQGYPGGVYSGELAFESGRIVLHHPTGNVDIGNTVLRATVAGNVLIGSTTDDGNKLDVNGSFRSIISNGYLKFFDNTNTPTLVLGRTASSGFTDIWFTANGDARLRLNSDGEYRFYGASGGWGTYTWYNNGSEKMRLTLAGNLLLNSITDFGYKLDVNGSSRIQGNTTISSLAGAGTRMVVADDNGVLSTQAISGGGGSGNWNLNGNNIVNANIGFVSIGTSANPAPTDPQLKLAVNGNIYAQKLKITQQGWADYVFEPSYKLMPLSELEVYINKNKHLPDVPSATDVETKGLDLGDNQTILLKKIEELTLYVIELKKEIETLKVQDKTKEKKK